MKKTRKFKRIPFLLLILFIISGVQHGAGAVAQRGLIISTVAGLGSHKSFSGDGGPAASATLGSPHGAAFDSEGNLYIADTDNHCIRKITRSSGRIFTLAGRVGIPGYSGDGGSAVNAQLNYPCGIALDNNNNIFVTDTGNHCVRRIGAKDAIIRTIAGTPGKAGYSGDGSNAVGAELNWPWGIAVVSSGDVLIADNYNSCIRKVNMQSGKITTFAGKGRSHGYGGDAGKAESAKLCYPHGVTADSAGNVYIADTGNHCIRKVSGVDSIITTIAGMPQQEGYSGDGGASIDAMLRSPYGVTVDHSGNIYIADTFNYCIRKVKPQDGKISTIAGIGEYGISGNRMAPTDRLTQAGSVTVDAAGNLFILEFDSSCIRKMDGTSGKISLFAGKPGYSGDSGKAMEADLNNPYGIAVDSSGNMYIADSFNHRIRRISAINGRISTIAGNGAAGYGGDGGPAVAAKLNFPYGVAVDALNNIYIADTSNHCIRKVSALDGTISTIAGKPGHGGAGENGIPAVNALLAFPRSVAVDSIGNVYIADSGSNTVQRVSAVDGSITVVANLKEPAGVTVDRNNNVYIADTGNSRIVKIDHAEGTMGVFISRVKAAGIAVDLEGNIYAADPGNSCIQRIDAATGKIQIIVGRTLEYGYSGDGGLAIDARLSQPFGVAVDSRGNIFVADTFNHRIRKVSRYIARRLPSGGLISDRSGLNRNIHPKEVPIWLY